MTKDSTRSVAVILAVHNRRDTTVTGPRSLWAQSVVMNGTVDVSVWLTDDGSTDLSISENVADRFRVAGWHVVELDGHDIEAVSAGLDTARLDPRPSMLACRTVIAKGIARLQGQRGGHSGRLFEEDAQAARDMLGWKHDPFEIPADVQQAWRTAGQRSAAEHQAWQARIAVLPAAER